MQCRFKEKYLSLTCISNKLKFFFITITSILSHNCSLLNILLINQIAVLVLLDIILSLVVNSARICDKL